MSTAETHDPWASELGAKLRASRVGARLTLQEVAEAAGVSRSFLSQVERGRVSPSIATLRRVADALATPMAHFFGSPDDSPGDPAAAPRPVIARHERKRLRAQGTGFTYELLSPAAGTDIEFLWGYFDPGATAPDVAGTSSHAGEEAFVCVRGSVVFVLDGEEHAIEEGDSISFDCTRPHRVENRGHSRAELVIAITPPSY